MQPAYSIERPKVATYLPEGKKGVAKIDHFEIKESTQQLRALIGKEPFITPGKYARLLIHGDTMMSDTDFEWNTNQTLLMAAKGDVLIAGLGIGLVLPPILDNPKVKSVTVVEKYQDVIDLVGPSYVNPRLRIVCADIFKWKPRKGQTFNALYFDIWSGVCTDNLKQMDLLRDRFKPFKKRGGWLGCWRENHLRRQAESRYGGVEFEEEDED